MPEHTSFLTYLPSKFPGLAENAKNLGTPLFPAEAHIVV
jgi:hypothetical protein